MSEPGDVDAADALDAERFRAVVEAAPDGVIMVDRSGAIRLANGRMEELFGYDRVELVGHRVELLLPESTRERHAHDRERYVADPHTRPMGIGLDLVGRHRDGHEIPVEVSLSPLDADTTIAIVRDVSARREAEAQLRASEEHVRLLEDRDRIARDLHDHVIQRLFAAGMALEGAVARSADQAVTERVAGVVDDLDDTIRQLRSVIFDLQDRGRAPMGLRAQLLELVAQARPALGHDPRVRFEGPVDTMGDSLSSQVLAVLRELLSNVGRHAGASSTEVLVVATAHELVVEVSDDGTGPPSDARSTGHGLRNLEERAAALGGTFELTAAPAGGTRALWRIPVIP